MKKIRTRQFFKTLYTSMGIGGAFLLFMLIFGKSIAANSVTFAFFQRYQMRYDHLFTGR